MSSMLLPVSQRRSWHETWCHCRERDLQWLSYLPKLKHRKNVLSPVGIRTDSGTWHPNCSSLPGSLLGEIIICRLSILVFFTDIPVGIMIFSAYGTWESQSWDIAETNCLFEKLAYQIGLSFSSWYKLGEKLTVVCFLMTKFSDECSVCASQCLLLNPSTLLGFHFSVFPKLDQLPLWIFVCQCFPWLPCYFFKWFSATIPTSKVQARARRRSFVVF